MGRVVSVPPVYARSSNYTGSEADSEFDTHSQLKPRRQWGGVPGEDTTFKSGGDLAGVTEIGVIDVGTGSRRGSVKHRNSETKIKEPSIVSGLTSAALN